MLTICLIQVTILLANDRINQIALVAEKVIDKFKADPFQRLRVLYDVELRPFQWEWWFLMDTYPDIIGNSCFRVGKTYVIQIKNLDEKIVNPYEEEMIFAPRYDQAVETFKYQYDVIDKQRVVNAMIRRNSTGKLMFGQGNVEFMNNSRSECFGVTSNFEGKNATIQHVDELDDIPPETMKRVKGRSTGKNRNGLPTRHRFTGVIWGKLNIWAYEQEAKSHIPGSYYILPKVNVYQGLAAGYLEEKDVMDNRRDMTDDEWLRTQCLMFVESRNFIWAARLRISQFIGLKWGLTPIEPIPGGILNRASDEYISFGLDMGSQGSGDDASDYALEITLGKRPFRRWIYGKRWPATSDPEIIIKDVVDLWKFFRPNGGYGDALQANLIAQINDRLYEEELVRFNWRRLGHGNEQESWYKWAQKGLLTPIRNEGHTKHYFYDSLKKAIDNSLNVSKYEMPAGRVFIFPQIDRMKAKHLPSWKELQILIRELENLQAERTRGGYLKITRIHKKTEDRELQYFDNSKLSDDGADALAMSNYFIDYLERVQPRRGCDVAYIPGV